MNGLLSGIISLIMMLTMSTSAGAQDDNAAVATAEYFMSAMAAGNIQEAVKYVDEDTVGDIMTIAGDEESTKILYENLCRNLSYETLVAGTKGDVAVVKMNVTNSDFSGVVKAYDAAAYEYITNNIDSEDVTDKGKLSDKCLEIYLDEIKKKSELDEVNDYTIYIPLVKDEHNNWSVLLNKDIMKTITGNLEVPELQK